VKCWNHQDDRSDFTTDLIGTGDKLVHEKEWILVFLYTYCDIDADIGVSPASIVTHCVVIFILLNKNMVVTTCWEPDAELYSLHCTSGNQLRLTQPDGHPGCTVCSKAWHCCDGVVDLFVKKRWVFIILLFQLGLVEFRVSSVKWVKSVLGLGLGSVIGLTEDFPT